MPFAKFGGDDDAKAVGDHDQQLVAAGMAEAVVDVLEPIEVDEQHRRLGCLAEPASNLSASGAKVQSVRQRSNRVVHAQRMGIFDRRANLGKQAVDGSRQLWHGRARSRRGTGQVALFDRQQAIAERGQRSRAFTVGSLGSDVADQQAEGAGDNRGKHLLVNSVM